MDSINRTAIELVDEALDFAGELKIVPHELDSEATVIDFGVEADGGIEAGILLAEIQTAGLANLTTRTGQLAGTPRPYVEVSTDHPAIALLCSQKAGWELSFDDFEGLGSGPARALVGRETEFERVGYYDESEFATLAVESASLPDDAIAEHAADLAGVDTSGVFLPTFATGSIVGSVTMAARAPELAMFRLLEIGYDPTDVLTATGSAPVAPVSYDEDVAMGRTNDALAYGGEVYLQVARDDDRFDEIVSTVRDDYGTPFIEVFEDADWDFHDVPETVFAPASVTVDVVDGPTYSYGETDEDLLAESFGMTDAAGYGFE
ncbi:methenyltetrahydromethanopterin cyclohydrolase [Halopenitus malekzadehii]|uniref:Methenyltetrahydromethanopterin cyclohydrolase n=1 Tax=Halopenitus malekzadehii TaxID=1267564 RepID=A0A1H6II99_9EURY|nr:methenyltetrahydromethanopterin cyclohydrolase [Halopenitus malekzadehii]SEH49143.1 methenyltetrahydromethanopterin cyclohydrolase [Halopenitus malekzadehii]